MSMRRSAAAPIAGSQRTPAAPRWRAAFRAGAAPRTESASPRDILRPCGGRCRCRPSCSFSTMVSSDSTSWPALGVDQLPDAVAHRLGRMRLAAVGGRDRRGEEIFQFEDAAAGRHVFVGGDARHRRFVHADGVGDGLEIERPQMLDAVAKNASCWRTISLDTFRMVLARWSSARSARSRSAGIRRDRSCPCRSSRAS